MRAARHGEPVASGWSLGRLPSRARVLLRGVFDPSIRPLRGDAAAGPSDAGSSLRRVSATTKGAHGAVVAKVATAEMGQN